MLEQQNRTGGKMQACVYFYFFKCLFALERERKVKVVLKVSLNSERQEFLLFA